MPCPKNVDIPGTFAAYNRKYTDNYFSALKEYFMCTALRKNSSAASNCIECGKCELHCPQHIAIRKELKNAKRELEKCRRVDINNTITLRYLQEVDSMLEVETESGFGGRKKTVDTIKYHRGNETIIQPLNGRDSKSMATLTNILVGIVIGVAAACFLILPARIQDAKQGIDEELKIVNEEMDAKTAKIAELEQKINELERSCDSCSDISLIGVQVTAKPYGVGTVIEQEYNNIKVSFEGTEKSYIIDKKFVARPRFENDDEIISVFTEYGQNQEQIKRLRRELAMLQG
jgi:ferredoxin